MSIVSAAPSGLLVHMSSFIPFKMKREQEGSKRFEMEGKSGRHFRGEHSHTSWTLGIASHTYMNVSRVCGPLPSVP